MNTRKVEKIALARYARMMAIWDAYQASRRDATDWQNTARLWARYERAKRSYHRALRRHPLGIMTPSDRVLAAVFELPHHFSNHLDR